jgi:hypothetical protein
MSILLQLPRAVTQLLAVHGADCELVQVRPVVPTAESPAVTGAGAATSSPVPPTKRMLHVFDEYERLARERARRPPRAENQSPTSTTSAPSTADGLYLESLRLHRRVLEEDPVIGRIVATDDPTLWPTLADLEYAVDLRASQLSRDAAAALRRAFEAHSAESTATGLFQLTEVSDVRKQGENALAARTHVMRRTKAPDVTVCGEANSAAAAPAIDAFKRHCRELQPTTVVNLDGGDEASGGHASSSMYAGNVLVAQPSLPPVSAILVCDLPSAAQLVEPAQLTLTPAQEASFVAQLSGGTPFAAARPSLVPLVLLCEWERYGLDPWHAAQIVAGKPAVAGSRAVRSGYAERKRLRVRSGVYITSLANPFPDTIYTLAVVTMAGAASSSSSRWWTVTKANDGNDASLLNPPTWLTDAFVKSFRDDLRTLSRQGAIRWVGMHQPLTANYEAEPAVALDSDPTVRVVMTRHKRVASSGGAPATGIRPLLVVHGPKVNLGCLPVPGAALQALRDGIETLTDLQDLEARLAPMPQQAQQHVTSITASIRPQQRLTEEGLKDELTTLLAHTRGRAPLAAIEAHFGDRVAKTNLRAALSAVAKYDRTNSEYILRE